MAAAVTSNAAMHTGGCAAQDVCDGDCSTTTKPPRAQTAALTTAGREFVVPFGEPCSHGSLLCVVRVRIGVSMMLMGRCQFFFYPIPRLAPQVFFFRKTSLRRSRHRKAACFVRI